MFNKVLIANRGEIAVRVLRSCRELGLQTVAVFSDADRTAPHVLMADEAVRIGPPPSSESYLLMGAHLEAAAKTDAEAIHPGYGFLSESGPFARQVEAAGLVWIGPPAQIIEEMGDKLAARKRAVEAGVPVVPGLDDATADPAALRQAARDMGYPVLVKAAGGGGGKGMRLVERAEDLSGALEAARSEAGSAFADDRVYLEKYLAAPHHIEVQIFSDRHGRTVSLGERECSVQRRYQKVVEETPSPFISDDLRRELGEAAVRITSACGYIGAGTVEFLVDGEQNFHFLEMNTRLQVEHPVTELVTGLDLVAEQLRVAGGEPLSFSAEDIRPVGHAIECRIYAEDGFDGFAPSIGTILELTTPGGPGVRLDHGIRSGMEITPYYDPLLGKLCTWGANRDQARRRMSRALEELRIVGIRTTVPFCVAVMEHPAFVEGRYDTHFINRYISELRRHAAQSDDHLPAVAALGAALFAERESPRSNHRAGGSGATSPWLEAGRRRQRSR